MTVFIPEDWLVSGFTALEEYINAEINNYVLDDTLAPAGLQAYELVMDYPTPDAIARYAEIPKSVIHLAIDDIDNRRLGFGPGRVDAVVSVPGVDPGTVSEQEATWHVINFDVGIWASDQSGGSTSRLRAYQMLHNILGTEIARNKCFTATGGVEIRSFTNGRFIVEALGEIRTYRMIGAELVVRVASRTLADPDVFADQDSVQQPEVEIDGLVIDG